MTVNEYQKKAIETVDKSVCLIATAGSGKTSTIVERADYLVSEKDINPQDMRFICFNVKAAEHMKEKLIERNEKLSGCTVSTIHSFALDIIKKCNSRYKVVSELYGQYNSYTQTKTQGCCDIMNEVWRKYATHLNKEHPAIDEILLSFIRMQLCRLRDENDLDYGEYTDYFEKLILKKIYRDFMEYMAKNKLITMDMFMVIAVEELKAKPNVLQKVRDSFQYLFVDEYQDVSDDQSALIKLVTEGKNVFAVGDCLQAIYGFRGGNSDLLRSFKDEFPNVEVLHLPINYRCSKEIVACANEIASYTVDGQSELYEPAVADKRSCGKPVMYNCNGEETTCIVDIIDEIHKKGDEYKDIVILARTNFQLLPAQTALFKNKIPYICLGMKASEVSEIKMLISYLSLICDYNDNEAFRGCINTPTRYIGRATINKIAKYAGNKSFYYAMDKVITYKDRCYRNAVGFKNIINQLTNTKFKNAGEALTTLYRLIDVGQYAYEASKGDLDREEEIRETLAYFKNEAKDYATIQEYTKHLVAVIKAQSDNDEGVVLMTIHKSKGLEYKNVILSNFNKGSLPHKRATDIEEEKRLLYVAATRAENRLFFTANYEPSIFSSYFGDTVDVKEYGTEDDDK